MAVIRNPHAPIGRPQPFEQIGRDDIRERLRVSIERLRIGRPVKSLIIVGLQGVGKTVLLNQFADSTAIRPPIPRSSGHP
jgi:Holliday junction resolvasome RuvABC ATP-dependent DNA helicase subunit